MISPKCTHPVQKGWIAGMTLCYRPISQRVNFTSWSFWEFQAISGRWTTGNFDIGHFCYWKLLINLCKENEYDSDVYSPLPKHRNASLRERVSSVNSEVTIHDVRRCTITGTWVQLTSANGSVSKFFLGRSNA